MPKSAEDVELYELKSLNPDEEPSLRSLEDEYTKTLRSLGWKWKTVIVGFRNEQGDFEPPQYTLPSLEEEEE
ncbi:hypothetical protein M231_07088 [Tremella mesenterica]|uniref:Uncharacterized protein n=1 Tax=Tremella mesenterica TaxID=5217 RepID=A0A4Q1BA57_TREME|nr:hypothetical protein M231_07088 [Tremella mesenterica]